MLTFPVRGPHFGNHEYTEPDFSCCLRGHLPYRGILKLGMLVFNDDSRPVLSPVFLVSDQLFMLSARHAQALPHCNVLILKLLWAVTRHIG